MQPRHLHPFEKNTGENQNDVDPNDAPWPPSSDTDDELDEPADFDGVALSDALWDTFIPDEDEQDPEPDPRDFYREAED